MAKETIFIYIGMIILLVSMVSAAPAVKTTTVFTGDTGIRVETPTFNYIKLGEGIEFPIHTFNVTSGMIMTSEKSDIKCSGYVLFPNGSQVYKKEPLSDYEDHWMLDLSSNNFTILDTYAVSVHCNNSDTGGSIIDYVRVTKTGNSIPDTYVPIVLIISSIFIILFYLILTSKFVIEAFTEHAFIKMLFLITSMWLVLFPLNISKLLAEFKTIPLSIAGQFEIMIQIIIWINVLITFYFIIWFSVEIIKKLLYIKHQRKTDQDTL